MNNGEKFYVEKGAVVKHEKGKKKEDKKDKLKGLLQALVKHQELIITGRQVSTACRGEIPNTGKTTALGEGSKGSQ